MNKYGDVDGNKVLLSIIFIFPWFRHIVIYKKFKKWLVWGAVLKFYQDCIGLNPIYELFIESFEFEITIVFFVNFLR